MTSNRHFKALTALAMACMTAVGISAQQTDRSSFLPEVHGTIRAKYEYEPQLESSRFQVRNARISFTGNVNPTVAYKAEIDLSDEGQIKMLDAYARLNPLHNFDFTIGQMRVPFTIDAHRSPHQQYFANRSFIAKQVGNVRDVGATVGYKVELPFEMRLEAGLFNGSGLTNQKVWHDEMCYSAKVQMFPLRNWNITASIQRIKPEDVSIDMYDIGTYIELAGLHVEAEYLHKVYSHDSFGDVSTLNTFLNYDLPLRRHLQKISFLVRYDMMDDHSNGVADSTTGLLKIDDWGRQRITAGLTFSLNVPFTADVRVNYERYYYDSQSTPKESERNKYVIEFMTRF